MAFDVVAVVVVVAVADSHGFFDVVAAVAVDDSELLLVEDEEEDSSSEAGLDLEASEAAEDVEEVVSEIFPKDEFVFQLGVVCFFQAG